jgi:hypothetical protein
MPLSEFDKGWIVGFIESNGVFTKNTIKIKRETKSGIKKYCYVNPTFYIVNKDKSALETIRGYLKMGKINRHGTIFHFGVRKKSETLRLAELLDGKFKSELRSQQFERWKERVMEWKSRAWGEKAEQQKQKR